jgi:uncharacterized protein YndB with AHSA1/START domain
MLFEYPYCRPDVVVIFDAPRERLFEAWTTPNIVKEFFGPGVVKVEEVEIDPRVGGTYRVGFRRSDGELLVARGVYRELRAPEKIVCTWAWDEDDPALAKETLLTVEFRARDPQTELILTHDLFRDSQQRDNHEHGWTAILDQLPRALGPFTITGLDLSGYMVKDAVRAIAFYRDPSDSSPLVSIPKIAARSTNFPTARRSGSGAAAVT